MKETLRHLLDAEQAGRQAASRLEEEAAKLLAQARTDSEMIERDVREATAHQIAALKQEAQAEVERGRQLIAQQSAATSERLRQQAEARRVEAVARVMGLLLGEIESSDREGKTV
jgi:hypothetical protein